MKIELLKKEDYLQWATKYKDYQIRMYPRPSHYIYNANTLNGANTLVESKIADNETILVIKNDEEEIVGSAVIKKIEEQTFMAYESFVIDSEVGKGYGTKLYQEGYKLGVALGAKLMFGLSAKDNSASSATFRSIGCVTYEEYKNLSGKILEPIENYLAKFNSPYAESNIDTLDIYLIMVTN